MSEKGFAETRMEEIAAAAGVGKGTLYLYYPSKASLLTAIAKKTAEDLKRTMDAVIAVEGLSLREKLERAAVPLLSDLRDSDTARAARLLWLEGARRPELVEHFYEDFFLDAVLNREGAICKAVASDPAAADWLRANPYLLMAPIVQAVIWSGIAPEGRNIDFATGYKAYLRAILPDDEKA